MKSKRDAFKSLTGEPTGKWHLRGWEDCIRIDLTEIGGNTRTWIDSAQVRDNRRVL